MSDLTKWIWLSLKLKPGSRTGEILLRRYGSVGGIYDNAWEEDTPGVPRAERYRLADRNLDAALRILDFCTVNGIFLLTPDMPEYPVRLRRLINAPPVLYGMGSLPPLDSHLCLGVVGTRHPSSYGMTMAGTLSYQLAASGAVIVSGMAKGIDTVAAEAALAAGKKTVAVVGTGLDLVYPPENRRLRDAICQNGAVISEFAPGTPPDKANFPIRNRLISGLCQGCLIIEGGNRSGARCTMRHARDQGRDQFAVPGRVGEPGSFAPNEALKAGAIPVTEAYDILCRYESLYPDRLDLSRVNYPLPAAFAARLHEENAGGAAEAPRSHRLPFARKADARPAPSGTKDPKPIPVTPPPGEPPIADSSPQVKRAAADSLGSACSGVYARLPETGAKTADQLVSAGVSIQDVLTALTFLELRGVVRALPGGLYERT